MRKKILIFSIIILIMFSNLSVLADVVFEPNLFRDNDNIQDNIEENVEDEEGQNLDVDVVMEEDNDVIIDIPEEPQVEPENNGINLKMIVIFSLIFILIIVIIFLIYNNKEEKSKENKNELK